MGGVRYLYIEGGGGGSEAAGLETEPELREHRTDPLSVVPRARGGHSRLLTGQQPVVGEVVPCMTYH